MVLIVTSSIGIFAFKNEELVHYRLFDDIDEAVKYIEKPDKGFIREIGGEAKINTEKGLKLVRKCLRKYAKQLKGYSDDDLNEYLTKFGIAYSRKKMKRAIKRDKLLIQATNGLDDLNEMYNKMVERLKEWYSLHYPELKLGTNELVENIIKYGNRENFPEYEKSTGVEIRDDDEAILVKYAETVKKMYEQKKALETYVKSMVKTLMPNVSSIIEPLLSARLLSIAGGMKKLARMTSSTIQLLGAEKALFRHLKKKGKSPKYGILFTSQYVQHADKEKRGKVARILSGYLMKAARIDYYSVRDAGKKLRRELEEKVENL